MKDQFLLGGSLDFRFLKHFGLDAEGYYSLTPEQETEVSAGVFETRQLVEIGVLAGVRAEWPIPVKEWTWRPRLMVGYGIMNTIQNSNPGTAASGVKAIQVTGIYVGGGIEVDLGQDLNLIADYSMSINTSAYRSEGGVGAGTTGPAGDSGFTRIRLAGSLRVVGPFYLGAQIILRSQSSDVSADVPGNRLIGDTNRMMQVLATASVVF
jgi:hypothetical protein